MGITNLHKHYFPGWTAPIDCEDPKDFLKLRQDYKSIKGALLTLDPLQKTVSISRWKGRYLISNVTLPKERFDQLIFWYLRKQPRINGPERNKRKPSP